MHRIVLKVKESVLSNVLQILNNFPGKSVAIVNDEVIPIDEIKDFDFSTVKVNAFRNIDPVEWQQTIRDEW